MWPTIDSRPGRRRPRQRGQVLVLAAVGLMVVLLFVGVVIDAGIVYVAKVRVGRAADAGALMAARHSGRGVTVMTQMARDVAMANFDPPGSSDYTVAVDTTSDVDTTRVLLTAQPEVPAFFMRMAGHTTVPIQALGEATRFPLDISLVLDVSGSLASAGVFDDLQVAAKGFVAAFDGRIDRLGVATFSTIASEVLALAKDFRTPAEAAIDALSSGGYTNIEEGLRLGQSQFDAAPKRPKAEKVLVLFTDGLPNTFREVFQVRSPPSSYDGVLTPQIELYDPTTGETVLRFNADGSARLGDGDSADLPLILPGGRPVTADDVRALGIEQAEAMANAVRAAGYSIYCVGLGNPSDPSNAPDLDLMRRIANEGGIVDPAQPAGVFLFAPTAAELEEVFSQIADQVLTRLTR